MSDRFESYETTLRNCLTESKEALEAKGVTVPEETKLRNVPGLIDGIEVGHSGNAITINCKSDDFIGQTLTAKHTDGTTVTKTIDSLTVVIEIPKDGEWTVTNSLNSTQFVFNFDTVRDLELFKATLTIKFKGNKTFGELYGGRSGPSIDGCWAEYDVYKPNGSKLYNQVVKGIDGNMINKKEIYKSITVDENGVYKATLLPGGTSLASNFPAITKSVNVINTNQEYTITFTCTGVHQWSDPNVPEPPSIDDEKSDDSPMVSSVNYFGVNTTEMSNEQIEEILNTIDSMSEQGKSDSEIEQYISEMEKRYGQI